MTKAVVTTIHAGSKLTVKLDNNFYSIEYSEDRTIPEGETINLEEEKTALFDSVNTTVDSQLQELVDSLKK